MERTASGWRRFLCLVVAALGLAVAMVALIASEPWRTHPVVALDERSGRPAHATDARVHGC